MKKHIYILILCLFIPINVYAEILYVRHGLGTGTNDGSSYTNAFQSVGDIVWDTDNFHIFIFKNLNRK